ncbi:class I SAM-dependent methyltransferase [Timonella sp. A28]|uniref:class I SAM-dependent methyltransferase n=1 Tax=Timonella sp. A28 TaxID=3442640 RepID=UPI003EB9F736
MLDEHNPATYWENRYASSNNMWSGRVNKPLVDVVSRLVPGSALDLGCGEGGDAVWLAQQGWTVTGIDLSPTAVNRGRQAATQAGIPGSSLQFEAADLTTWDTTERYNLVTASFLHSWPALIPREKILHRATRFVAENGYMLVVAHADAPPWASPEHTHQHAFPTPQDDVTALNLDPTTWDIITCETHTRETTGPDGTPGTLTDSIVFVRRTAQ